LVKGAKVKTASPWLPDRQDIIWIDCNLQAGQEMRDIHPFLVLSPRMFNEKTSLVIGLPMTTAEYNADNPFAVAVGKATGHKAGGRTVDKTSYVLCHQPKSFDWRLRGAKPHPLGTLNEALFVQVCERLNQIIQLV
jgi:mRNA interferase MazF